ncbi:MAG: alkaline phosphatase family protein [Actinomycetota bacterium]|nr:alkaline phosphatase family protein [Actinomycetota bacterium]
MTGSSGIRWARTLGVIGAAGAIAAATIGSTASADKPSAPAKHVLLLSIDGLHQSDLTYYLARHPSSALAKLVGHGVDFTGAQTPVPSDSTPGMVAQVTGGNPSSTGLYYDDTWNHALLSAGTTNCAGVKPGAEVPYMEAIDKNPLALDAGEGLSGLPGSILNMTGQPDTVIDPAALPVDRKTCQPVYPRDYLKVNTIFEVARAAGMRTAWSDKHPAYEMFNGHSGTGVQDYFTPEINSNAPTITSSIDWTKDNALTMQYDSYKAQAILNEINGYDHSGKEKVGTPAIFGMNFQAVSTAEKLPTSDGLTGGYLPDDVTPGPLLSRALNYINDQVGTMMRAIKARHLDKSTVIILSAKHGQSPQSRSALTRIPDGPIIAALNAAWLTKHPHETAPLVAFSVDDDGIVMWLNNRSEAATSFAKEFLLEQSGVGDNIDGKPKPYTNSGLAKVYAGAATAHYFHVPVGDPRVPDLFGISKYGVVYTGKQGKIAEHGGANPQDRNVPIVVSGDPLAKHGLISAAVETTQIAPTILQLLGLDPSALRSVQIEHTAVLPLG